MYGDEIGGFSGFVLIDMSLNVIKKFFVVLDRVIFIIGVGGIDLLEMVKVWLDVGVLLV